MDLLKNRKTITCWLPLGESKALIEKLMERGILQANASTARGAYVDAPVMKNGLQEQSEFEVLTVVVDQEQADEIFEYIYFEGKLDRKDGGFMFMAKAPLSSPFTLPEASAN